MPARAPRLEVSKEVLRGDVYINCLRVSEFSDLCVSNDSKDELCCLLLHCLVCCAVRALGFVRRFSARANDVRGVVVNCFVQGPDSCWFRERLAVARDVCGLRPNKADQLRL